VDTPVLGNPGGMARVCPAFTWIRAHERLARGRRRPSIERGETMAVRRRDLAEHRSYALLREYEATLITRERMPRLGAHSWGGL
jgi:hypothetical protein